MSAYTIIDVDTHVTEVPDLWSERLPARMRDAGPRVETDKRGRQWWMIGDKRTVLVGLTATAGVDVLALALAAICAVLLIVVRAPAWAVVLVGVGGGLLLAAF